MPREGRAKFNRESWKLGYNTYDNESETNDRFFSETRGRIVREAVSRKEEPESLKLGAVLRKSHIELGMKALAPPKNPQSEMRARYQPKAIDRSITEPPPVDPSVELRKSNIDHAYGQPKTCNHWTAVNREEMSRHAADKFKAELPMGFQHLAAELRKSSVPLSDLPAKYRPLSTAHSEAKLRFVEQPQTVEPGFAATLGKDLRKSHYDIAGGKEKHTRDWRPVCHGALADHAQEKWDCKQPQGFQELGVELRKSSVPLAGSGMDYMLRGPTRRPRPG